MGIENDTAGATPAAAGQLDDDGLLKQIREFTDQAISAESDNRNAAVADLQFLAGDQWPEQIRRQRQLEGRPCLTFNRLPTYLNQVTNDQRQNKSGIKVHPVGGGADIETAELYQGMIRHIENDSNADIAYDTAVNSAASIGFGFWRVITEYESPTSFDQVLRFQRVRDALKVYFDPASVEADGSDAKRVAIVSDTPRAEFERQYPEAAAKNQAAMSVLGGQVQPGWMSSSMVRVVEFYYFDYKNATLYLLGDGTTTTTEPPAGVDVKAKRETQIPQLKWVKATAGAVIERTDIMCKWIPVFPVWGTELDIQGKVTRKGIIRDAKDPAQMYNFWMTNATEEVSLRPKAPFIGAVGQFASKKGQWAQANSKSFSFLEYDPVTVDGVLAPPPQRQPMADVPVGMLQMAVHAADNIKAVTGMFDASLGAQGNETSGRAITARKKEGDTANFHYTDNLNRSIRHCGRCLVNMIPHYYDARRVVQIMRENGDVEPVEVNAPAVDKETGQAVMDPKTNAQKVLNDLTVGEYGVTFSAGPSYATQREEAAESMIQLGQSWPKLMDVAGDKVVEAMDWPGADKIAARIKATMPANITAVDGEGEDGEGGPPPLPPEIEQHIQQAEAHIQQLEQALQKAQLSTDREQIAAASREEVARITAQGRADVAELAGMVQMLLARIPPPAALVADAMQTEDSPRPAASQAAEPAPTGPTGATPGS